MHMSCGKKNHNNNARLIAFDKCFQRTYEYKNDGARTRPTKKYGEWLRERKRDCFSYALSECTQKMVFTKINFSYIPANVSNAIGTILIVLIFACGTQIGWLAHSGWPPSSEKTKINAFKQRQWNEKQTKGSTNVEEKINTK